jgi:hypothetical protein
VSARDRLRPGQLRPDEMDVVIAVVLLLIVACVVG